ncbi:hypothetical protein Tco_0739606 [Tanacetum coccineum]
MPELHNKMELLRGRTGPSLDAFDDLDADLAHGMDYMDTEEAVTEGRQSKETEELNVTHDTEVLEKGGSNEEPVNAAGNIGVDEDIFLADALEMLSDKAKLKGVEIKEKKDAEKPARSIFTLKPLLKIDPKDKGKGVLKEEPEPVKVKSKDQGEAQIERDAEIALKMNKKVAGVHEEKALKEPDSTKVEVKQEGNKENTRKRPGRRLKMKATKKSRMQKTDSDLEEEEHLKTFLKLVPDEEEIIYYEVL